MKKILLILVLLLFFISLPRIMLSENPFSSNSTPGPENRSSESEVSLVQKTMRIISNLQRNIRMYMSDLSRDINKNPLGSSFWYFLLAAFGYGVVHALGPGHGKSVVSSYFLSRPGRIIHGTLMANMITLLHVGSATVAVSSLYFILQKSGMHSVSKLSRDLEMISYGLILVIGLLLFLRASFELLSKKWQIVEESQSQAGSNIKELVTLSLATGIVPCPGAAIILTFALTIGIIFQGYLAMLAIALGMGLTTTFFALLALGTRSTLLKLSQKKIQLFSCLYYILSFAGAFFILVFGAVMLIGAWPS